MMTHDQRLNPGTIEALEGFEEQANTGDIKAQYQFASLLLGAYRDLLSLPPMDRDIRIYLEIAIRNLVDMETHGVSEASFLLGLVYDCNEMGFINEPDLAMDCYHRAHSYGNPKATSVLGIYYIRGIHVKKNKKQGLEYLKQAAYANVGIAQDYLSMHYIRRFKIRESNAWTFLAAKNGIQSAIESSKKLNLEKDKSLMKRLREIEEKMGINLDL